MNTRRVSGTLLVLSFVLVTVGVLMFVMRDGTSASAAPSFAYLAWERSIIVAAAVVTAVGLIVLQAALGEGRRGLLGWAAAAVFVVAVGFLAAAEATELLQGETRYPLIVTYVVLAFLAQAAIGGGLLSTTVLPAWIGWVAIAWNIGWLAILVAVTPGDVFFPILHHIVPLLVGGALLRKQG